MASINHITAEDIVGKFGWADIVNELRAGHAGAKPLLGDQFIHSGDNTLLSRSAWIEGLGVGVKSVTVMPSNAALNEPTIHGAMLVFDDQTGRPIALIDSNVITYWKTASDSVLGASLLARPNSKTLLVIGAGTVGESIVRAYQSLFPSIEQILIYNRTYSTAQALALRLGQEGFPVTAVADIASAAPTADIISCATMSSEPILHGDWVHAGTHVDLIGAFKPDMREADDALLQKSRLFVDCKDTTLDHIGELMLPLASGAIERDDVLGDLYDLVAGRVGRNDESDITVFKNGGGAHLDLMTAKRVIAAASE